jgi:hypothetical protein
MAVSLPSSLILLITGIWIYFTFDQRIFHAAILPEKVKISTTFDSQAEIGYKKTLLRRYSPRLFWGRIAELILIVGRGG